MVKNFSKKMKLGLIGLALSGLTTFNSPAQNNYEPRYKTLSHKMLQIENSASPCYPDLETLDRLIDNSKTYIPQQKGLFKKIFSKKKEYTEEEISEIAQKIYNDSHHKLPSLRNRGDICYRSTLINLAILEENKIPAYATKIYGEPGHIKVIVDQQRNGHNPLDSADFINQGDINIETLNGKTGYSDRKYIERFCLTPEILEKEGALKQMSRKEMLCAAYWHRGKEFVGRAKFESALNDFDYALKLNPNSIEALHERAVMMIDGRNPNRDLRKAFLDLEKILSVHPVPGVSLWTAEYYDSIGKNKKSLERYTQTIDLITNNLRQNNFIKQGLDIDLTIPSNSYDFHKFLHLQSLKNQCLQGRGKVYGELNMDFEKMMDNLEAKELQVNLEVLFGELAKLGKIKNLNEPQKK